MERWWTIWTEDEKLQSYNQLLKISQTKTLLSCESDGSTVFWQGIGQLFAALVVGMARNPSMKAGRQQKYLCKSYFKRRIYIYIHMYMHMYMCVY